MRVRGEALELAFRLVLSCPCDVTHEQELAVFEYLRRLSPDEVVDYAPVLAVFDREDTPFHQLAAFTTLVAGVDSEPVIEREHILRLHGSSYHWEHAASTLPGASRRITSVSRFLLAHLILPVSLDAGVDGEPVARYAYQGGSVRLESVFLPLDLAPVVAEPTSEPAFWALHFAAVLGRLAAEEVRLLAVLHEANQQLVLHRAQVEHIDYRDFELQGDNRELCRRRYAPFWGAERA